jgi:predicted nucleic acid-binding protein
MGRATRVIVDASVIVRWFLWDEPYADQAATLREKLLAGRDQTIVPDACWMEVSHALARAIRRGRLPAASVEPAIRALADVTALIDSHEVDPVASLRVALELGLGAYDSGYLVLSRTTGQSLITADRRQYEAGIAAGYDVIWLGDVTVA